MVETLLLFTGEISQHAHAGTYERGLNLLGGT